MDDKPLPMDDEIAGSPSDSGPVLPQVQVPSVGGGVPGGGDPAAASSPLSTDQTVPLSRALVPTPEEAADSDLIEKEWVIKAKQIVEHTSEDPFRQQEELAKMKADYMKKRYNKDIGQA